MTGGRLAVALGLLVASPAGAVAPDDLPDPRPVSRVLDRTGTLDAGDVDDLDVAFADDVAAGRGEVMVVLVDHLDVDGTAHEGATALFNRWRIGSAARNDGVLLLLAVDDGQVEVVLGDGLADRGPESQAVIDDAIVPRLDDGDPRAAIVDGVAAIRARVLAPRTDPTLPLPVVLGIGGAVLLVLATVIRGPLRALGSGIGRGR